MEGIPGSSCRLHTIPFFFFLSPFLEAVDNFDKSFVCPAGVWLGCGFRWGVRRGSLNVILGAKWLRGLMAASFQQLRVWSFHCRLKREGVRTEMFNFFSVKFNSRGGVCPCEMNYCLWRSPRKHFMTNWWRFSCQAMGMGMVRIISQSDCFCKFKWYFQPFTKNRENKYFDGDRLEIFLYILHIST